MLRDLGLRNTKNLLKMADAQRTTCEQMDDPQPRSIAETLVDLNQFQECNMVRLIYMSIHILSLCDKPRSLFARNRPFFDVLIFTEQIFVAH